MLYIVMGSRSKSGSRLLKVAQDAGSKVRLGLFSYSFKIFLQVDIFISSLMVYYCSAINSAHTDLITMMKEQLVLVSILQSTRTKVCPGEISKIVQIRSDQEIIV